MAWHSLRQRWRRQPPDVEGGCKYFCVSSCRELTTGGPPPLELGRELTAPCHNKTACYKILHRTLRNSHKILVGKSERKTPLGKLRHIYLYERIISKWICRK
jgi:hypothetical protein